MARFTPVGPARAAAVAVLSQAVTALHVGDGERAAAVLGAVEPQPADRGAASVAGCIGVAVALLDEWLGGRAPQAPSGLAARARLPQGHWTGEQAAQDLLGLAAKARAHSALMKVIVAAPLEVSSRWGLTRVLLSFGERSSIEVTAW